MTAYVNAARLNKRVRVQIYKSDPPRNAAGGVSASASATYTDAGEHWFGIEPLSVAEQVNDQRVQSSETHRLVARADQLTGRLRARDRLVHTDRYGVARVYDLVGTFDVTEEGRMTQTRAIYRPDATVEV